MLCTGDVVLLGCYAEKNLSLSAEFKTLVLSFDDGELPRYNEFEINWKRNASYTNAVYVVVKEIKVSPSRLDEVTFKENNAGKTVEVTDHSQSKIVTVSGSIDFMNGDMYSSTMLTVPFEVTSTFKNDYTTIKGDREACSAETLSRLDSHPVPVPTDESMLLDVAKRLNDLLGEELRK